MSKLKNLMIKMIRNFSEVSLWKCKCKTTLNGQIITNFHSRIVRDEFFTC